MVQPLVAPEQAIPIHIPPLFVWQQRVKACPARYRICSAAQQIGKTSLAVLLAMDAAMKGGDGWWVAPDYSLTEPGLDLLDQYTGEPPFDKIVTPYKQRKLYIFQNGNRKGTIQVKSADDPKKLRGKPLDFVILDEAAFMDSDAWHGNLIHRLTVRQGWALLITNPYGKNWLWELWRMGDPTSLDYDPDYASFKFSQYDSPLISPEDIEKKRKTMPFRRFEAEVLGEFVEDGGEVFVGVRQAASVLPHLPPLGLYDPTHTYVAGMDLSAGRQDYSVIIITDVTAMAQVAMYRFSTPSLPEHMRWLREANDYWRPEVIEVEENSQAMFAVPEFEAMGLPVRAWNANWKSKRELIENYAAAIELQRYRLLNDAQLVREHEAMESNVTASGHVQYNAPKGQNDDTVTAGALSYRAATVRDSMTLGALRYLPYAGLYGNSRRRERRKYR